MFFVIVIVSFVVGILLLTISYFGLTTMSALAQINTVAANTPGIGVVPGGATMVSFGTRFFKFFPDITVIFVIIMIAESWMLSAFLKSHPLGAVVAIVFLVLYTIVSFYISNEAVAILKTGVFNSVLPSNSLLALFYLNMPVILIFATIIDIAIGVMAARSG
jgi:hypothetical protein